MGMTSERIETILLEREQDALLKLINDPTIEEKEKADVIGRILKALEEQFYEGLPELVVRVCVEEPEKVAWVARHSFLSYWLKRQGYYDRPKVIESVISRLKEETGERLKAAIRTAWVIGYRDDELQLELERIAGFGSQVQTDPDVEGWALAVLASLAYSKLDAISLKLQSRLSNHGRLTESDCWTAKHAATPEMIPALSEAASSELIAVSALLDLPIRYPDLAKNVFDAFKSLEQKDQSLYGNTLTSKINLLEVGDHVLSQVLNAFQQSEKTNILPPVNQFLNANRPNQLLSFVKARDSLSLDQRTWLKVPALKSTRNDSDFQTSESLTKEAAWDVILRLGLKESRQWLPEAMEGEENFTLLKLAEFASFLKIETASLPLGRIVRDEKADFRIGLGCLDSLGVLGNADALTALLESRVHKQEGGNDDIPMALIDAIASACMTQKSCGLVWKTLCDAQSSPHVRRVCAYVIEDLSEYKDAPLPPVDEVVNWLRSEGPSVPGYDSLLLALPRFHDSRALDFLRELGASEHESNELTQALAVSGLLAEFPRRIEQLGLRKKDNVWLATDAINEIGALALLCLYRSDTSFEPAMVKVLEDDSLHAATQIVANLRSSDLLSSRIRQSLWARALKWNERYFADKLTLEAVARTWPEPLLQESFVETVSRWDSSARRAYISSLREALHEGNDRNTIAELACRFLVDEEAEVRRDAARLALESDLVVLRQAVHKLAEKQDDLDQAIFLLDAAFWVDSDWDRFAIVGISHREPVVRGHCQTLKREREGLLLARTYLSLVLKSEDYLETWCYGQALLELGNEETVDQIYSGLPSEVYRRSYLIWLAKKLKKRLEQTRKDQSDKTYLPPPAARQQLLDVSIELDDQLLGPFPGILTESYSRRAHRWLWSWSISIKNQPELVHSLDAFGSSKFIYVKVDGRRGRVLPAKSKIKSGSELSALVVLQGTGALESE